MVLEYKPINIVHFVGGVKNSGAFKGANLLHKDLLKNKVNSEILYDDRKNIIKSLSSKIRQNIEKLPKIFYPNRENTSFSSSIVGYNFNNESKYKNADIVHLHWINNGFFDISKIQEINKPIVWTIRDMWPFTGGCHYSLGCNKFQKECGECPQLKSKKKFDLSTFNQNRKLKYFNKKISFVVNSNWMKKMAEKSKILKDHEIFTFFPSFDLKSFYEDISDDILTNLKINKNKKIILYGAQNIEAQYKGFNFFLDSLDYLDKEKYLIIFFGNFWKENKIREKKFEYLNLGFINDIKIQRKLYSIADVFVATSLQEGFPKTVAESLLCHTPVVYFKDTAIEDICEDRIVGGYGANYCDSADIARGIDWIIENKDKSKDLAILASNKIKKEFNSEELIKKYLDLYNFVNKKI